MVEMVPSRESFDLYHTLTSGQVFRWKEIGDWWVGILNGEVLRLRRNGERIEIEGSTKERSRIIRRYFRMDDPYDEIVSSISKDPIINKAVEKLLGLRLVRQDPWECTISYICATNSNIPSIKRMIERLSERFGEAIDSGDLTSYSFPTPEKLARADIDDVRSCGVGYRARFIQETALSILSDPGLFHELFSSPYLEARSRLMNRLFGRKTLPGIGPKVADCILLFSLEKLEAFPIDVWIARNTVENYSFLFEKKMTKIIRSKVEGGKSLGSSNYERLASTMRGYFGRYAGYAQEFLYHYYRTSHQSSFSGATHSQRTWSPS